jgi:hypothetical protein
MDLLSNIPNNTAWQQGAFRNQSNSQQIQNINYQQSVQTALPPSMPVNSAFYGNYGGGVLALTQNTQQQNQNSIPQQYQLSQQQLQLQQQQQQQLQQQQLQQQQFLQQQRQQFPPGSSGQYGNGKFF